MTTERNYDAVEVETIKQPAKGRNVVIQDIVQHNLSTYTGDLYIAGNKIRMMAGSPAIGSTASGFGRWASGRCYHGTLTSNLYVKLLTGDVMILPAGSAVEVPVEAIDHRPGVAYVG